MIVHHPFDVVFESFAAEIDEQAKRPVRHAQIGDHLLDMQRLNFFSRFNLDQQFALNQQIGAECIAKGDAIYLYRNRLLSRNLKADI